MAFHEEVGVDNLILLEELSAKAIVNNLKLRFEKDIIYTYIGAVLVSMNPYKGIPIYDEKTVDNYRTMNLAELPPHIFALSDNAYKALITNNVNQSVLISGESGAGKTEALKRIILYISKASSQSAEVERVCYQLKESVPFLEAFGNAKTIRNDNSSRFGKYMDIEINFKGAIVGARVINYLLEKARVIKQTKGERNFHIFYQLLAGDRELLQKLFLTKPGDQYNLINQGACMTVDKINDKEDFDQNVRAMEVCAFSTKETYDVYALVASCLHLYEINYEGEGDSCKIIPCKELDYVVQLLNADPKLLEGALTGRTITVGGEKVKKLYNKSQAQNSRDSLIKAMYDRCFNWLVLRINVTLSGCEIKAPTKIGLLDIYGFEIFEKNGFEQFCINFCNEHLHQLFVQRTLKMEQEEYGKEGIPWEKVDFFDNRPILDLIEENKKGIIYVLDEECVMPGERSDMTFLQSMEQRQKAHPFFASYNVANDPAIKKLLNKDVFLITHYAGKVKYNVDGFLEKNRDSKVKDLKIFMNNNDCLILKDFYTQEEIDEAKRPPSAGMQFKNSLSSLVSVLMKEELYYIRCLKPNEDKKAGYFNETNVEHQVMYLGLMENIRVCRSGYAYRKPYESFLKRYYPLSKTTWPTYGGDVKANVLSIIKAVGDYEETKDFGVGKTKIFIRSAKVVMVIEQNFQKKRSQLAADIQALFKADRQKNIFHKIRGAIIVIQKNIRRYLARKKRKRLKWANLVIKGFIVGYRHYKKNITSPESCKFFKFQRFAFLARIAKGCPLSVMEKKWPTVPSIFQKPLAIIKHACYRNLVRIYLNSIKPGDPKDLYLQKVTAEKLAREKERAEREEAERQRRAQLGLPVRKESSRRRTRSGLFGDVEQTEDEDEESEWEECEEGEEGEDYFVDALGRALDEGLKRLLGAAALIQMTDQKVTKKKRKRKKKIVDPGKLAWEYIVQSLISTYEGCNFDEDKLDDIRDEELREWVVKRCRDVKQDGARYINRIRALLDQAMLTEEERNPPITRRTMRHVFTVEQKAETSSPDTKSSEDESFNRLDLPLGKIERTRMRNTGAQAYTIQGQEQMTVTPSISIQAYPVHLLDFNYSHLSHGLGAKNYEKGDFDKINAMGKLSTNPDWSLFADLLSSAKSVEIYDETELNYVCRGFILLLTQYPEAKRKYKYWRRSKATAIRPKKDESQIFESVERKSSLYYLKKSQKDLREILSAGGSSLNSGRDMAAISITPSTTDQSFVTSSIMDGSGGDRLINAKINIISQKDPSRGDTDCFYLKFGDTGPEIPLKSVKESESGLLIAIDNESPPSSICFPSTSSLNSHDSQTGYPLTQTTGSSQPTLGKTGSSCSNYSAKSSETYIIEPEVKPSLLPPNYKHLEIESDRQLFLGEPIKNLNIENEWDHFAERIKSRRKYIKNSTSESAG